MQAEVEPEQVARARNGDVTAFEALVEARVGSMTRTAMAILGREDEARDAVQDALVTAWRELASLRDPGAFDAWLTRILVNRCRRGLRRIGLARVREIPAATSRRPTCPRRPMSREASSTAGPWSAPSTGCPSTSGRSSSSTTSTGARWRRSPRS